MLVLGAHPNPDRYGNLVPRRLISLGYPVVLVGKRRGNIENEEIKQSIPEGIEIHTVTMYLNAGNQKGWETQLEALKPKRIVFNPGAENPDWYARLEAKGIEAVEACTLVLLSTQQF